MAAWTAEGSGEWETGTGIKGKGRDMASRLDCVGDWEREAAKAKYRVAALAAQFGITERQLHRFFKQKFGISPHAWMMQVRMARSHDALLKGALVKEAAAEAGFQYQENFSRQFKIFYKIKPKDVRGRSGAN
jgi:AraC-like DNA-binding protein